MRVEVTHLLAYPRERVWNALLDPAVLARVMPGVEKFEQVGPDQFAVAMKLGVPAVRGNYTGSVQIADKQAPASYRLRGEGKGGPGFGGGPQGAPPGDALIEIHVAPHPWFRRDGDDIHMELPVSLAEAVLGARVPVATRLHPEEPVRGDRLALPLQRQRLDRVGLDRVPHEVVRQVAEEHLGRPGRLLEACRDVHGVAHDEPLAAGRVARDDLARVHARAVLEPDAPDLLELDVERRQRLLHLVRRPDGAQGVVLVELRQAEDGHDRVADELLDRPAMPLELRAHCVEVARHYLAERLGVEPLAEARRPFQVGEDDRDGLAHLLRRRRVRKRRAAEPAQAEAIRVLLATAWANLHRSSVRRLSEVQHPPEPRR